MESSSVFFWSTSHANDVAWFEFANLLLNFCRRYKSLGEESLKQVRSL